MAILIYKKGNTITTRGVDVDFVRIEPRELSIYVDKGYVTNPRDLIEQAECGHTLESLSDLHWKKVDVIAKELGVSTDGNKKDTIKLILEAQENA